MNSNNLVNAYSQIPDNIIYNFENNNGAQHYDRLKVVIRQTKGCWLTDINNNNYLDCLAAYSAANPGHHHPKIINAMIEALNNNFGSVISNVVYTDLLGLFLNKISEFIPQLGPRFGINGNKALPKNGGVESVETAIKAARYYGWKKKGIKDGNQEIIVFDNNFHGRMTTIISFSTSSKYKEGFGPLTPGFISVEYGNINAVKKAITPNTCGILVEPMQGEGGMNVPPTGFLKELRELSDNHDILLLFDEIQVGLGRTGKTFCFEHEKVIPDGLILGKALSGGLVPLSIFATNSKLMDTIFTAGSDGSTFGGYPLACAAGIASINVIKDEKLSERSALQGKLLKNEIENIVKKSNYVKEVRGRGLFIGIELKKKNAMSFCRKLLKLGIIANDSHHHTIRISPPLVINDNEIDFLCQQLKKILINQA